MAYSLSTSYVGESLLSGFDWFNGTDPSNGFVSYQSRPDAQAQGLYSIDEDTQVVRLGVDSQHTYGLNEGRPSIRLESKESYDHGLFIADFLHMPPSQCGLWPAFWTYGSDWPNGGELDIIEGANTAHNNIISAHTAEGCFQDESQKGLFTGEQRNKECSIGEKNIGCGYNPPASDPNSYGDSFNAVGGGVYAMQWDEKHIRVWHFARGDIPADIASKQPNPDTWGLPEAVFGGKSCDVDSYFKDMSIVININFCGDYGNAVWKSDKCTAHAPTCPEYVANNPKAFSNAYWDVKYIDAYTWQANATAKLKTTTTMTPLSATTLTASGDPTPKSSTPATPTTQSLTATPTIPSSTVTPTTPISTPTSPANPVKIKDHAHLGCFESDSDFHNFKQVKDCKSMTLESCVDKCGDAVYAGVFESKCYCADSLHPDTRATSGSGTQCSNPCPGNSQELCGGPGHLLTLYAITGGEQHPAPPPMATSMPTPKEKIIAETKTCTCHHEDATPVQTKLVVPTGSVTGGNETVSPPPVSAAVEHKGPSKLSVVVGVVVMGIMMIM